MALSNKLWTPILVIVFLFIGMSLIGSYVYVSQKNEVEAGYKEQLTSIVNLKVDQITSWRDERILDGRSIMENSSFIYDFNTWRKNRSDERAKARLSSYLKDNFVSTYETVLLTDIQGNELISANSKPDYLHDNLRMMIGEAVTERIIILSDIHSHSSTGLIHLDLVIPLKYEDAIIGVVLLTIDPQKALFPLIKAFPATSKSAETLLTEERDGKAIYLNELRHQKNTALLLQIPMTDTSVLAVKGLNGFEGVTTGYDYRHQAVLGAIKRVPNTPWVVVTKIDRDEEVARINQRAMYIIPTEFILLLSLSLVIILYWKNYQKNQNALLLKSELAKQHAEKKLSESEFKFSAMFNSMSEGVALHEVVFDKNNNAIDYRIFEINPAYEKHTGMSPEKVKGLLGSEIYHTSPPPFFDEFVNVARTGIPYLFETYYEGLDRYFKISVTSPGPNMFATIFMDISERKKFEKQLAESESRLKTLSEATFEGLAIVEDGKIRDVNNQYAEMYGYELEEIIGTPVATFVSPQSLDVVAAALKEGREGVYEHVALRKDGTTFPAEVRAKHIILGGKRLRMSAVRDISERKRAEDEIKLSIQRLEQSNKELEQFAYVASHDLQEPLRMVSSFTQLLAKKYSGKLGADADEYIHYAVSGATRMQVLINDLLDYSRVTRKGVALGEISSSVALGKSILNLSKKIEENHALITNDELPTVMGDENQLIRLFQNLIDNAIKYKGTDTPLIHISAEKKGNEWEFCVRDNGIGIAAEHHERIFEIFERLHSAKQYPGTGIGLAICKKIVERHGGKIWVDSNQPHGTVFYFTLSGKE